MCVCGPTADLLWFVATGSFSTAVSLGKPPLHVSHLIGLSYIDRHSVMTPPVRAAIFDRATAFLLVVVVARNKNQLKTRNSRDRSEKRCDSDNREATRETRETPFNSGDVSESVYEPAFRRLATADCLENRLEPLW